jgi:hypothetical protein
VVLGVSAVGDRQVGLPVAAAKSGQDAQLECGVTTPVTAITRTVIGSRFRKARIIACSPKTSPPSEVRHGLLLDSEAGIMSFDAECVKGLSSLLASEEMR